jgi:hypothetical protein
LIQDIIADSVLFFFLLDYYLYCNG